MVESIQKIPGSGDIWNILYRKHHGLGKKTLSHSFFVKNLAYTTCKCQASLHTIGAHTSVILSANFHSSLICATIFLLYNGAGWRPVSFSGTGVCHDPVPSRLAMNFRVVFFSLIHDLESPFPNIWGEEGDTLARKTLSNS